MNGRDGARVGWTVTAASFGFALIQLDVTVVNVAVKQAGSLLGVALFGSLAASDFYGGFHAALWVSIAVLLVSASVVVLVARLRGAAVR